METRLSRRDPAVCLTDDLFVNILSRLPIKSLCCCKCVSPSWLKLISYPEHCKKLPQTLAGFFHGSVGGPLPCEHRFTSITGKDVPFLDPSFPLMTGCICIDLLDSCNGILLFRCYRGDDPNTYSDECEWSYVVANPATKKWVTVPDDNSRDDAYEDGKVHLAFDPTVPSHFHVIEYVVTDRCITGVWIYSSKDMTWNFKESGWDGEVEISDSRDTAVFLNGFLHILTQSDTIAAVDVKGESWRIIPKPFDPLRGFRCIYQTQGCLCFICLEDGYSPRLSIWILDDYGTEKWTLKHTINTLNLFPQRVLGLRDYASTTFYPYHELIAVHPDCNLIFFAFWRKNELMAYHMDRREMRVICTLGPECHGNYLPYVPLFGDSLGDKNQNHVATPKSATAETS